jgi:hypothetical protein
MKMFVSVLALMVAGFGFSAPASAQGNDAVIKSCRQQVNKVIGGGNASKEKGKGQRRQAMVDQCVRNGGKM